MKIVVPLSSKPTTASSSHIGQKAYMLMKISDIVDVPKGIVVTTDAFDDFLKANGCDIYLGNHNKNKISDIEILRKRISKGYFKSSLINDIYNSIDKMEGPFAVRSSCTLEDSSKTSFAGIFDSFLFVKKSNLKSAIKKVYLSLYSKRAVSYFKENKLNIRKAKIAIIIQQMSKGNKFGVCFSFPENKNRTTIIENSFGYPDAVTAGKGSIDRYAVEGNKVSKYPAIPEFNSLFDFEVQEIKDIAEKLSKIVPKLDMEYSIENGNKLKVLQLRPITSDINLPKKGSNIAGIPVSGGRCTGRAVLAVLFDDEKKEFKPNAKLSKSTILCTDEISMEDIPLLKKVGGLILSYASTTMHAAIIAREYKIPCISGIGDVSSIINPGERLSIDGDTGKISFLDRTNFSIEANLKKHLFIPDHTKLGIYRESKEAIITYPISKKAIAISYSIKDPSKVKYIVEHIESTLGKQCIDLGPSLYYDICTVLDLKDMNRGPYKQMLKAWKSLNSIHDIRSFYQLAKCNERLSRYNFNKAMKLFQKYKITKEKTFLIEALKYNDHAYSYWKVIDAVILRSKPAELIEELEGKESTDKFEEEIIKLQKDKGILDIGNKVVYAIKDILDEISKEIKIDEYSYSSKYIFISDLEAIVQQGSSHKIR